MALAITGVLTIFGESLFGVGVGKDVANPSVTPPTSGEPAHSQQP
jgi:hypothetical protein